MAHWVDDSGCINSIAQLRPGTVKYYIKHTVCVKGEPVTHVLAVVKWFVKHEITNIYLAPLTSWKKGTYIQGGASSFIPVQRLYGKFIAAHENTTGNVVLSELNRQLCF